MIDISVPIFSSLWSGTGTVIVLSDSTFCMMTWLLLRRTSANPCCASISQASLPDNTRRLANGNLYLCHVHFLVQPLLNFGG